MKKLGVHEEKLGMLGMQEESTKKKFQNKFELGSSDQTASTSEPNILIEWFNQRLVVFLANSNHQFEGSF